MSATGRTGGVERVEDDFYETPGWTTRALLRYLAASPHFLPHLGGVPKRILEPGCGDGAILRELRPSYPESQIIGVELNPQRAENCRQTTREHVYQGNFIGLPRVYFAAPFDFVPFNPPFTFALRFLEEAMRLRADNGVLAMLIRVGWMQTGVEEEPARTAFIRKTRPLDLRLDRRPSFSKNKDGHMGTDGSEYTWLVWGAGREGEWDILQCERARPPKSK